MVSPQVALLFLARELAFDDGAQCSGSLNFAICFCERKSMISE